MTPTPIPRERFDAHARQSSTSGMISSFNQVYDHYTKVLSSFSEVKPKPLTDYPEAHPTPQPRTPTYAIVRGGGLWRWSCGWQQYCPRTSKPFGPILGHSTFRKKPLIKQDDREWLSQLDRPHGDWRRLLDHPLYSHSLHGNVHLLATDGVHAIVEDHNNLRHNVHFTNLTELRQRSASLVNSVNKTPKEKKVRASKKIVIDGIEWETTKGMSKEEKMKLLMELM
jgi:hypothetical protein